MESVILTPWTVLSSRPPMEPIERPWPPEQVPPVNSMFYTCQLQAHEEFVVRALTLPELMAMQSSWFLTLAPLM